ncbi:MAG: hypothetical protein WCT39_03885 [Candidatus Margulisiibacteriota bacterium]
MKNIVMVKDKKMETLGLNDAGGYKCYSGKINEDRFFAWKVFEVR